MIMKILLMKNINEILLMCNINISNVIIMTNND